jgi:Flp pilus assembly protein TadG
MARRAQWGRTGETSHGEHGVTLVFLALVAVVLAGLVGFAVDAGRLFVARAELVRAADAAALAGVVDMPDLARAQATAVQYVLANDPQATATVEQPGGEPRLRVTVSKRVEMTFMRVLGIPSVTVRATATAGLGGILDLVMVLDETGSMRGQDLANAQAAARQLVGMLLPDPTGNTAVGLAPFRMSYFGGRNCRWYWYECVPNSHIVGLTGNSSALLSAINRLSGDGNTNICMGLWKGSQILFGPGGHTDPDTRRIIVLLSDGDNNPHHRADSTWPAECDFGRDSSIGAGCNTSDSVTNILDRKTYELARSLKARGVEIYVVGFGLCGTNDRTEPCDPGKIGTGGADNDRNLLKCIASSTPGTTDHYFEAENTSELVSIFRAIGAGITRLVE